MAKKNSPGCGCCNCNILGPLPLTTGDVADYVTVDSGSFSITADGLSTSSSNALAFINSTPVPAGVDSLYPFKLRVTLTLGDGDIARLVWFYTDANNYMFMEIKAGASGYCRVYARYGGVDHKDLNEPFDIKMPDGTKTLNIPADTPTTICLSLAGSDFPTEDEDHLRGSTWIGGWYYIQVGSLKFESPMNGSVTPIPVFGLGTSTVGSGPVVFKNLSLGVVDRASGCLPCSFQSCTSCSQVFIDGDGVRKNITAQFDSVLSNDECDGCVDVGGSDRYILEPVAQVLLGSDGPGPAPEGCAWEFCKTICHIDGCPPGQFIYMFVSARLNVFRAQNGQCLVGGALELALAGPCGTGPGGGRLSAASYRSPAVTLNKFLADEELTFQKFQVILNSVYSSPICEGGATYGGEAFVDEITLHFDGIGGSDIENECKGGGDRFAVFEQCCTSGTVRDPVSGEIWPAHAFYTDLFFPDPTKVYLLQVDLYGNGVLTTVCAKGGTASDRPIGRFAYVEGTIYDECTDCLTTCAACCDQYLQEISFIAPTINNQYPFDPDCAGIYAAYNARFAGQEIIIPRYRGNCDETIFLLPEFNYITSGGCATGTDGLIAVTTSLIDNGDGTYTIRINIGLTGSGGIFADLTYTYTQTGCLNCLTGIYTPTTSVNNLGGDPAPAIEIHLNGNDCSGMEMMTARSAAAIVATPARKTVAIAGTPCGDWKKNKGPKEWAALHKFALQLDAETEAPLSHSKLFAFADYLSKLQKRITCIECREEMTAYIEANTLFGPSYFAWTVAFHNAVNRKCGKPEISLEAAESFYRPPIA